MRTSNISTTGFYKIGGHVKETKQKKQKGKISVCAQIDSDSVPKHQSTVNKAKEANVIREIEEKRGWVHVGGWGCIKEALVGWDRRERVQPSTLNFHFKLIYTFLCSYTVLSCGFLLGDKLC